ncbi:MAG TPA: hypothetical protein VNQ79_16485 [Blastocatellia bacterium]|nr:hypothetical protein [Blastocatellia bacterium]
MKLLITVSAVSLCLLLLVSGVSSHEPITTNVTFNREVVRILQRSCLGCHRPDGVVGDISLTTYEQARPWAKAIKEEVLEKRMPPYQAVKGFGNFQAPYSLPQRDIELIVSWVEGGAPRGEEKDYPRDLIPADRAFGKPDLELQPAQAISIPAGEGEQVSCLRLPTRLSAERRINALDFRPASSAVLSAEFFVARQCSAACASAGERIGEWVPGQAAVRLPDDAGLVLPAGSCIVMKVRYRRSSETVQDRSSLNVYFAKGENLRPVESVRIAPRATIIPARAENQRVRASYLLRDNTEALAVRPLLFPLGKSVEVTAFRPDGSAEVLVVARNYRYNWQPAYYFRNPVSLPAGTRIEVTAYLDNSEKNRNLSDEQLRARRVNDALCELLLTKSAPAAKALTAANSSNSSGEHKH